MDEFEEGQDSTVRKFYQRISDLPNDWVSLEDKYYRKITMGDL